MFRRWVAGHTDVPVQPKRMEGWEIARFGGQRLLQAVRWEAGIRFARSRMSGEKRATAYEMPAESPQLPALAEDMSSLSLQLSARRFRYFRGSSYAQQAFPSARTGPSSCGSRLALLPRAEHRAPRTPSRVQLPASAAIVEPRLDAKQSFQFRILLAPFIRRAVLRWWPTPCLAWLNRQNADYLCLFRKLRKRGAG